MILPESARHTAAAWSRSLSLGDVLTLLAGRRWPTGGRMTASEALAMRAALVEQHADALTVTLDDLARAHRAVRIARHAAAVDRIEAETLETIL